MHKHNSQTLKTLKMGNNDLQTKKNGD